MIMIGIWQVFVLLLVGLVAYLLFLLIRYFLKKY